MKRLAEAFAQKWFYHGALVLAACYGFGGIVHVSNLLGFGELKWDDAPLAWKVGDIAWGILDLVTVGGILFKSPIGLIAMTLAAFSQVLMYGCFPQVFALTEDHDKTLQGLVYFNGIVLLVVSSAVCVVRGTENP